MERKLRCPAMLLWRYSKATIYENPACKSTSLMHNTLVHSNALAKIGLVIIMSFHTLVPAHIPSKYTGSPQVVNSMSKYWDILSTLLYLIG